MVKVTRNGIRLTLKGNTVHYRNEYTGKLIGRNVAVWLNTEEVIPDTITVTDTHNRNPLIVEKEVVLPSMTASNEDFEKAQAQVDAHNEYGKTLYRTITNLEKDTMFRRTNYIDPRTKNLGERMRTGKKKVSTKRQKQRLISRKEQQLGLSGEKTNQDSNDLDRKQRGLKLIEEAIK